MKKTIAVASLLAAAALFLSSCASVSKDWDRATTQHNPTAYEAFLQKHPDSQYASEAKARIEALDWKQAQTSSTMASFREFLQKHPDSQYASEAKARIEELDWKQAQTSSTMASFREFLQKHPDSQYASEAKARLSSYTKDAWEKTRKEDKINAYESFIRDYPESEYVDKAKERANWQRANRAIVQIDYPRTVKAGGSPYSNISGPIYKWDTVFKETGGNTGFKLKATNFYIRDPFGGRWSNSWSESVEVKPNGRATVDYWCDKSDKWAGGHYYTTWVGEDGWGNRISIEQKVHLAK